MMFTPNMSLTQTKLIEKYSQIKSTNSPAKKAIKLNIFDSGILMPDFYKHV
jgi:hypothetical protein